MFTRCGEERTWESLLVSECLLMRTSRCYHFCSEMREYKNPLLPGDGMREILTGECAGRVCTWTCLPVGHHTRKPLSWFLYVFWLLLRKHMFTSCSVTQTFSPLTNPPFSKRVYCVLYYGWHFQFMNFHPNACKKNHSDNKVVLPINLIGPRAICIQSCSIFKHLENQITLSILIW